jgi:hypothetical protein
MFSRLDVTPAFADGHDQLQLVVQALADRRVVHLADRAFGHRQHRIGRLHEEERRLAPAVAHLDRVFDVVAAHAVDAMHRKQRRRGTALNRD